jgi:nicotinamide N-methyltransferase
MSSDDEEFGGMFAEPEGYFKEVDTAFRTVRHERTHAATATDGQETTATLTLRLVPEHVLWGHLLYNASVSLAHLFDRQPELVRGKRVLELGAGAALPALVALLNGARSCVMTDYPEDVLIDNIVHNATTNLEGSGVADDAWEVAGYIWGRDPAPLLAAPTAATISNGDGSFDVIILADLICNHGMHGALLETCLDCVDAANTEARVFVTFSPHRPHLLQKDLAFFDLAEERGFTVTQLESERAPAVMFEGDAHLGQAELRSTVFMHCCTLAGAEPPPGFGPRTRTARGAPSEVPSATAQ